MAINERYWKTLCDKKVEKFKESDQLKAITEVLNDLHPNSYDLKFSYPDASEIDVDGVNMRDNNKWSSLSDRIRNYMSSPHRNIKYYLNKINLECVIHYPIVNIQNRFKLKHTIRDLYVKISFPINNENTVVDIDGCRATISKNEYKAGYAHSHLPRRSFMGFNNFCTGSSEMGCCIQKEFITTNKASIYQFLFLLQSYLEYESIEGIPHIRMEGVQNLTDIPQLRIEDYILGKLTKEKLPLKINNQLKIINTEEIELLLASKCAHKVTKVDGKYYSILQENEVETIGSLNETELFEFRGEKIKLKIDNYATETKPTEYCHPQYREAVIRYWENQILKTYIRKYRTSGQNPTKSIRESNESSKVPM